jgi:hypothetical protein
VNIAPGMALKNPTTYAKIQMTRNNELQTNVILVRSFAAKGIRFVVTTAAHVKMSQRNVIKTKPKNRYFAKSLANIRCKVTLELFVTVELSKTSIFPFTIPHIKQNGKMNSSCNII